MTLSSCTFRGLPTADYNADGVVDAFDYDDFVNDWTVGTHKPRLDQDLDGSIGAFDYDDWTSDFTAGYASGYGTLSRTDVGNRSGYGSYDWDPVTSRYHVRNRVLAPELRRWLRRDPIGYVDGVSVYEYVSSAPIDNIDSSGLSTPPGWPIGIPPPSDYHHLNPAWRTPPAPSPPAPATFVVPGIIHDALDFGGIAEPAPFCDATNAVLYGIEEDWGNCVISCVGIVPYVGDPAKLPRIIKRLKRLNGGKNTVTLPDGRRVDLDGKPHQNKPTSTEPKVSTPHVHDPAQKQHPDKKQRRNVRPATEKDLEDVEDYLDPRPPHPVPPNPSVPNPTPPPPVSSSPGPGPSAPPTPPAAPTPPPPPDPK